MSETSDGIEEAFEGAMRVAATVAPRTGEVLARAREDQLSRAAAAEEQHARDLAERLRGELAPVLRTEWWDRAGADDVHRLYTTARAGAGPEPETDRAAARIRDELRSRSVIDIGNTSADRTERVRHRDEPEHDTANHQRTGAGER